MTYKRYQKMKNKGGRPTKARELTRQNIEYAIKSTRSMSQAAVYAGVALNTFKKYAVQYDLWKPLVNDAGQYSSKGIVRSHNGQFTYDIKQILEGKSPNPFREQTLLTKAIKEGYMENKCGNCSLDFSEYKMRKDPPLMLDFLDADPQNTTQDNLRALCFNCMYSLYYTHKGWYRHREKAIHRALDQAQPTVPQQSDIPITTVPQPLRNDTKNTEKTEENTDSLTYIPFEEFQKTLNN